MKQNIVNAIFLLVIISTLFIQCNDFDYSVDSSLWESSSSIGGSQSDSLGESNSSDPSNSSQEGSSNEEVNMRFPIDLCLIYHGGSQDKFWTAEQIQPYIFRKEQDSAQWLFDGFLFLTLSSSLYGHTYYFDGDSKRGDAMANKKAWNDFLDRTFKEGRGIGGVEDVMKNQADAGNIPPYKRKVVISIPYPVHNDDTWGNINGNKLDFHLNLDRAQAVNWFINQVVQRWESKEYKHVELAGFYWLREEAFSPYDRELIQRTREHIDHVNQEKGTDYDFYWIPYNGAGYAENWSTMGFDIAYYQPNYFFSLSYPYSRLTESINFAKTYDMGMEMEFNGKMYNGSNPSAFRQRYDNYIQEFKDADIWKNKHVAYYEGGGAWLQMSKSNDPEIQEEFEKLADILAERKKEYKDFQ